jgi:CrcB protein
MGPAFNRHDRLMAPTGQKEPRMATIAAIAAGGSFGALARYGIDVGIEQRADALFPWSTFAVNLSGCFLVGVLIGTLVDRHHTPEWVRLGLVVGFCGAYTTFSTFAQETLGLVEERFAALALVNAAGSIVVGVLAVFVGERAGRML